MGARRPVLVALRVYGFGHGESYTAEIDRDDWEAMTAAERAKLLDDEASEFAYRYVGYGWHIEDPDDYAATGGE